MGKILAFDHDPAKALRRKTARMADNILALQERALQIPLCWRLGIIEKIDALERELSKLIAEVR